MLLCVNDIAQTSYLIFKSEYLFQITAITNTKYFQGKVYFIVLISTLRSQFILSIRIILICKTPVVKIWGNITGE